MNKWLKGAVPSIVAAVMVAFILMFSGLGTTSSLNSEGTIVTFTTLKLDVNLFAWLLILAVFAAALVSSFIMESLDKQKAKT